jgi:hypothetical protein
LLQREREVSEGISNSISEFIHRSKHRTLPLSLL